MPTQRTFNRRTLHSICWNRWKRMCARESATRKSAVACSASARWPPSTRGGVHFRNRRRNFAYRICVFRWYALPSLERTQMRAISAADAVSPAIQRTREFLFRPFNLGTYLKLGLVAMITEGFGSNFHSSSHNGQSSGHGPVVHSLSDIPPGWIAAILVAVLAVIVLSLLVFYLVTRLRFAFFHCLIHNTKLIRPGWRLYREQAARFFWLNLAAGFCFLLLVVLIL